MGAVDNQTESAIVEGLRPGLPPMHPDGFVMPRILSPLPEGADFALADQALADMAAVPGPPLLPWQRFVIRLGLMTVNDRLWWTVIVVRVARQQGKTFLMRRVMWHRLFRGPELFGQPQRIINTHFDAIQAVRLMKPLAHSLGYGRPGGGKPGLQSQTFMSQWYPGGVESEDESVWWSRAMTKSALTGNEGLTFAFVDELQDAKERQVEEALGGSLSSPRIVSPQRWFAGTGEKFTDTGEPTSDLLRKLKVAREVLPTLLWVEWSAPPGTPPWDEQGWRWASPDWSDNREAYLRTEFALASAGRTTNQFAANYLLTDTWHAADVSPDVGVVDTEEWSGSELLGESGQWQVAAVNVAFGCPPVVGFARAVGARVLVSCVQCTSMAHAGELVAGVPVLLAAKSVCEAPELRGVASPRIGTVASALSELRRLMDGGLLVHDGGEVLRDQVLGARIGRETGASGVPRVTSRTRLDAVQAAMWAATAARANPSAFWSG